jgi:hypothetical protein
MPTQQGQRMVFDNAKALIRNAGFDLNQAVLSQSYLRGEVAMSTSVTAYHIPVLANDVQNGSAYLTEWRLNLQDAFIVSQIGVFVSAPATSTTTNFPLVTYPNKVVFSTSGADTALYNLYHGRMDITINNRQVMPAWDLYRHLKINQSQQGVYTGTANTGLDQNDATEDAYFNCEPNIVLVGSKNNQITFTLPAAIGTLQASTAPRIVVIFRGILAQNVTPVR